MIFTKIKETCIYTRNLDEARRFYAGVLGLPIITEVKDKHIFFRAGASVLLCFNPNDSEHKLSPPPHGAHGKIHFALEVASDSYEDAKKETMAKGILIKDEVTWPSGARSFYFDDPFGNVLEILPDRNIWD